MIRKLRLGNTFPRKLLHVQKTRLGVGLIEPNAVIVMREMIFHVCKNTVKGDLSKTIEGHEQNSFVYSGLNKEGYKAYSKNKHWK